MAWPRPGPGTVGGVGVSERLKNRFRRFLERPGTTVDLRPFEALLPQVTEYGGKLSGLTDAELAEEAAAVEPEDLVAICALAREAAERGLGERSFDVQLLGALAMLSGHVAEMATGEGKTLAAAIAAFGYARRGEPVHILTVNDYLARRDAEWMEPVYRRLAVTVGWINELSTPEERRAAYACDVTYGAFSEVGYDYLRDQLAAGPDDAVQRDLATVLVDEADSILVDEARVPLVLAGARAGDQDPLRVAAGLVHGMRAGRDFEVSADGRSVGLYRTTCGMTATGALVGDQLREFYRLEVAVIPSNAPVIRVDEPDRIYATREHKEAALVEEVAAAHEEDRPVLVGTLDVKESERLAARLRAAGVEGVVLH